MSLERIVDNSQTVTRYFNTLNFTAGHNDFPVNKDSMIKGKLQTFSQTWQRVDTTVSGTTYLANSNDCVEGTNLVFGSRLFG